MYPQIHILLLLLVMLNFTNPGCANNAGIADRSSALNTQPGTGSLVGNISLAPISPVERIDAPPASRPAAGAKIRIMNLQGKEIKTAVADTEGRYSVNLPAGSYRIELDLQPGGGLSKDLPATVMITQGHEIRLDIRIDTGIR